MLALKRTTTLISQESNQGDERHDGARAVESEFVTSAHGARMFVGQVCNLSGQAANLSYIGCGFAALG